MRGARISAYLREEVDAASLALFRVAFGAILLCEVIRYFKNGWIQAFYVEPRFFFSFVPGLLPWGGRGMLLHFGALGVLAALISLGLFYRAAAPLFCAGFTYVFLLDKAQYLNHFYLVCLLSFLLALAPANRALSLDRLRAGPRAPPETVPRAVLWILRAQIALVYFYGGVAKLGADWLRGEPLASYLTARGGLPILGTLIAPKSAGITLSVGGLVFDLLAGFMLLWPRTFPFAAVAAIVFNIVNASLFNIGIFPFLMIATLVLFPDPSWPRRLVRRAPRAPQCASTGGRARLVLLATYLVVQIALPLRHFFYRGDVDWDEEGHRFSWRMKLRDKEVAEIGVYAVDPVTNERSIVDLSAWLTGAQIERMASRPDMIRDFARMLADRAEADTGVRPKITALVIASLNGGPTRPLLDPTEDLAAR